MFLEGEEFGAGGPELQCASAREFFVGAELEVLFPCGRCDQPHRYAQRRDDTADESARDAIAEHTAHALAWPGATALDDRKVGLHCRGRWPRLTSSRSSGEMRRAATT